VTLRRTTQSFSFSFADNAIDLSVIRDLTDQDLKDLGVLLGHRRKILRAITELDGTAPPATDSRFRVVVLQAWQCRCGATDPWESG
jgi:SAM domain (Sterile alpha motif)